MSLNSVYSPFSETWILRILLNFFDWEIQAKTTDYMVEEKTNFNSKFAFDVGFDWDENDGFDDDDDLKGVREVGEKQYEKGEQGAPRGGVLNGPKRRDQTRVKLLHWEPNFARGHHPEVSLKNEPFPGSVLFLLVFFKQTLQFLQYNMKNVHPIFCDGIQTHDLLNANLLP